MRTKSVLIPTLLFGICITGCDPATYYFDRDYYENKIESIELRYLERNETPITITISDAIIPYFKKSESSLIQTLNENKIHDFVMDFSKVTFHRIYDSVNKPFGYIVVMNLDSGNYIAVSLSQNQKEGFGLFSEFDANENFVKCFGRFADGETYNVTIKKYFESFQYTNI